MSTSKKPPFHACLEQEHGLPRLDIGEGKEIDLIDKCPRSKLQQLYIKYLGPIERKAYEVVMKDGKLLYKLTWEFLDTTGESKGSKWIFVLSMSKVLYVGIKKKGSFQHSSCSAGRIVAEKGTLKAIWPHRGHYRPTQENFQDFISFLKENDVDTTYVKMDSDEDKELISNHIRTHSSEEETGEKEPFKNNDDHMGFQFEGLFKNSSTLEIPNSDDTRMNINSKNQESESCSKDLTCETILDGYEPAEDLFDPLQNDTPSILELSDDEDEPCIHETFSKD